MRFASLCSGIEAPSVAWLSLGWEPVFFSEIEKFPSVVLNHHYPNVPNLGDMTKLCGRKLRERFGQVDILVAGTPCQSFSVAGNRAGMDDPRGQLAFKLLEILRGLRPLWLLWENVPGVLSSNRGRDFGALLAELGKCGYGFTYRVLDAQYFGVPQRRRRVFLIGYLGDWRPPGAVLLESESLQGCSTPRKRARNKNAETSPGSTGGWCPPIARTVTTREGMHHDTSTDTLIVAPAIAQTLTAFWHRSKGATAGSNGAVINPVIQAGRVRTLTPKECERLQGLPDDYTKIAQDTAKTPRYKAIGNSIAVPVLNWIGRRIQMVSEIKGGGA